MDPYFKLVPCCIGANTLQPVTSLHLAACSGVTSETSKMPNEYLTLKAKVLSPRVFCVASKGTCDGRLQCSGQQTKQISNGDPYFCPYEAMPQLLAATPTAHLNFTAAEKICRNHLVSLPIWELPPPLSKTLFRKDKICFSPAVMILSTWLSFLTKHGSFLCYSSGACAFSICRHCWIWHLSLSGINYWSSMLSWPLSWMLRILWYL